MSVYRIATPAIEGVVHVQFAASNKAARGAKKELAESHGVKPSEIEVTEVDIRKRKTGLIEYLNGFHAQIPAGYVPAGYQGTAKKKSKKAKKK